MRCFLKRIVVSAIVCLFVCLLIFTPHPAWVIGVEYREVGGRDYSTVSSTVAARTHGDPTTVAITTTKKTVKAPAAHIDVEKDLTSWLPDTSNILVNYFTMRDNSTVEDLQYKNGMLVYLHLNKAAGSTTKRCLGMVSANRRRKMGPVLDSGSRVRMQAKLSSENNGYNTLMGGYAFGICDVLKNKTCSYFTILRDPYERLMSSYTYCRRAGMDQTCQALGPWDASLQEWAVHQGSYFFRQLLMKPWFCTANGRSNPKFANLTGIPHAKRTTFTRSPCWFKEKVILKRSLTSDELDAILQYCVDHLEDWFSMIGLTDEYDLSLAMLERIYQNPFQETCTGKRINVSNYNNISVDKQTGNKTNLPDIVSELRNNETVYNALKADIVLYEKALEIFERQKKAFLEISRT